MSDMTETGIVALAGVAATLLSGLGAAWLSNRAASRREREQRSASAEAEIRSLIVRVIVAARGWSGATAGITARVAESTTRVQFQATLTGLMEGSVPGALDLMNHAMPDSDYAQSNEALRDALVEAKIRLGPGALRDRIVETESLVQDWVDVIDSLRSNIESPADDVGMRRASAKSYADQWRGMIRTLEDTAADVFGKL